ncbi:rho GTPase-activating protein 23 isoform X2 [Periophthalmus magnuspinnatus]|uniref:rho GTPase-activating protein 23 isoform X2 n=1 Tax=Periophthalmus magnuspinnatus TaxID=409849 RepID=UPI00145AB74A|nr:rho GTPase-activating protein 23 isoform X2 [Periophthalmus magnuspinnatus]
MSGDGVVFCLVGIPPVSEVKGERDGITLSNKNRRRPLSSGEVEGFSWRAPRTVVLQKNSQGFGFTLRHFIVYPPESSLHSLKDKENGNTSVKGCAHSRLEPMDTIFVKSVRENGPAQTAGLCTGDRLVKVNGESILGKTYSQVIALIQNSDSVLELSIVPKDQDILQLACSQDSYHRRNHPHSGEVHIQQGPPPLCDSCSRPRPLSTLDNCPCRATFSPLDNSDTGQDYAKSTNKIRSSSTLNALEFHFANHHAAIASATLPPPRKSSLPASTRAEALCRQALSEWYYSQAQAAEHLSPRSRGVSQDRLAGLGIALGVEPGFGEPHHTESLQHHRQVAAAAFQDPYRLGGGGDVPDTRGKACSQNLLAAYADYEHNYGRSVETLKHATTLVSSHSQLPQQKDPEFQRELSTSVAPTGRQGRQQVAEPQTPRTNEVGYSSYSPSFSTKSTYLLQHAHTFREDNHNTAHLSPCDSEGSQRPLSSPVLSPAEEEWTRPLKQEVIMRKKPSATQSCRTNGSLAQQAFDSLSSIPFIASMKNRRSSYLLAVTTERSKSCDEGLNIFKDEGRVFSKLPKRVKSFFLDGSLDSLRAQEEARSKRHSTSELGTTVVSNVRKEGWLHCKQVLSEKGKKLGGGIRPWKRVFSVLRSHSLFLYKDKREAVLHGAGAVPGQEEHSPISVRGCLIDIAYSETKRKNALRLTTQDFCEYLLQAESREDMLSWIKAIRDNSKSDSEEIGFSRQALINKKLNDYRKHSLTGHRQDSSPKSHRIVPPSLLSKTDNKSDDKTPWGINLMKRSKKSSNPKAFGVRLEDCQPAVNHKFVPLIVEMCCAVVEAMGLEYTGIYRVPGNNALVSSLQEHLNKGLDINTGDERFQDLNVISSLLKSFFRKIPEPLFTDDKYSSFIEANRIEDADSRLKTMKTLIHSLPDHYFHTLKFLVEHLKRVADYSEKNKMEPRNLALVFGPTLVRTSEDNMMDMVTHMPDRYKIIETLILHCDWFFSDGPMEKEEKAPDHESDSSPVPNIDHLLCNIGRTGGPGDCPDSTIDSLKLKISLSPKKDPNAKELISAMTRKRKISPDHLPGISSEENLEHEPVKSSNLRRQNGEERDSIESKSEVQGGGGEEGQTLQEGKDLEEVSNKEEVETEIKVKYEKTDIAQLEALTVPRPLRPIVGVRRGHRLLRPHSFHLLQAPPEAPAPLHTYPSRAGGPAWVSRSRIPPAHTSSFYGTQSGNWAPAVPLRCKKSFTARTRALSMTLELEGRARGWRTDKVEVIRVNESGVPQGSAIATVSYQETPPVPWMVVGTCPWSDPSPSRSSVVLRRLSKPQEQNQRWRRHTVMV